MTFLRSVRLLVLACGSLLLGTTAYGQFDTGRIDALLSKLRSSESGTVSSGTVSTGTASSAKAPGAIANQDSSLVDTPSPSRLAELIELVLRPCPNGRKRFFIADNSPRGKLRRERLRESLRAADLLDELTALAESQATQATRNDSDGILEASQAIQSMLFEPTERDRSSNTIQVKRSSANFELLGWGPGTYQSARSEHFAILSQAGEKPTAEVAQACEVIYSVWQELFAEKFPFPNAQTQAFRVVLLRNREAYVRALKTIEPRISISTGYYSPEHRIAFFYWESNKSFPTLVHELTHQFFDATCSDDNRFDADQDPGAWALEAVALYMESWSEESIGGIRVIDIGGWDAPRFQAGRFRRLRDQYWIPWEEFSMADGKRLRADPDVAAWYSQACGLAHFWLDRDEASRDRFLDYLAEVYKGQGNAASSRLTSDLLLRTAYDQFLLNPAENRPAMLRRNEIVLTRCPVDSQTLLNWPLSLRKTAWLDLGFTQVDDRVFTQSGQVPWDITRLNLESTQITDASMAAIASMKNLTELDLSGCKVTDAGLEALANHPSLKQLWLTNSTVTDRSIEVLASIPRLERLEASGSLSAEGYQQLLKKKPRLKRP